MSLQIFHSSPALLLASYLHSFPSPSIFFFFLDERGEVNRR